DLIRIYTGRFPRGSLSSLERSYRAAHCLLMLGDEESSRAVLKAIVKMSPDSDWGKLAALRLGNGKDFVTALPKLLELGASREEAWALLELAQCHEKKFDNAGWLRLQTHRARALLQLEGTEEAGELLHKLVAEHPDTEEAARAAFALACLLHRDRKYDK